MVTSLLSELWASCVLAVVLLEEGEVFNAHRATLVSRPTREIVSSFRAAFAAVVVSLYSTIARRNSSKIKKGLSL